MPKARRVPNNAMLFSLLALDQDAFATPLYAPSFCIINNPCCFSGSVLLTGKSQIKANLQICFVESLAPLSWWWLLQTVCIPPLSTYPCPLVDFNRKERHLGSGCNSGKQKHKRQAVRQVSVTRRISEHPRL